MFPRCIYKICIRCFFYFAAAGIVTLQPLAAADKWSRVERIKPNTQVYITLTDQDIQGLFVSVNDYEMIARAAVKNNLMTTVSLARDQVLQVVVAQKGRRWYSIPLAIAAGAAGGLGGYKIANQLECAGHYDTACGGAGGLLIGVTAGGSAGIVYRMTLSPSQKVIYKKP